MRALMRSLFSCLLFALMGAAGSISDVESDTLEDLQSLQGSGVGTRSVPARAGAEGKADWAVAPRGVIKLPKNQDMSDEYRIGPRDLVEIRVFQVEELQHTARVNSKGLISVPLVGTMRIGGLTESQAEHFLAAKLGETYLQDPQVSVFVKEYESRKFTVEGEVKDPGVFALRGPTTLLQAIAMADGLERLADADGVVLFRAVAAGKIAGFVVDLEKVRSGEVEDPLLAAGDKIVVPREGSRVFLETMVNTLRGFIGFGIL
jgi:polysaccharide export outer membrane protein